MALANATAGGSSRPLTGGKVFMLLSLFFGVVAAADATMIFVAMKTFRGEETSRAYEKGLAYNLDIAVAREQAARDWKVEASILRRSRNESIVSVALRDAAGVPITGLDVSASIRSPVDATKDQSLTLAEIEPGLYEAPAIIEAGWRDLLVIAERDRKPAFRSKSRIRIE
jgi:nitrogen fixation protein FixH